jgi:hypothetical protein
MLEFERIGKADRHKPAPIANGFDYCCVENGDAIAVAFEVSCPLNFLEHEFRSPDNFLQLDTI